MCAGKESDETTEEYLKSRKRGSGGKREVDLYESLFCFPMSTCVHNIFILYDGNNILRGSTMHVCCVRLHTPTKQNKTNEQNRCYHKLTEHCHTSMAFVLNVVRTRVWWDVQVYRYTLQYCAWFHNIYVSYTQRALFLFWFLSLNEMRLRERKDERTKERKGASDKSGKNTEWVRKTTKREQKNDYCCVCSINVLLAAWSSEIQSWITTTTAAFPILQCVYLLNVFDSAAEKFHYGIVFFFFVFVDAWKIQ